MDSVFPILMVVPDDVAREFPIGRCICGSFPIYVNLELRASRKGTRTHVSAHDPRNYEYVQVSGTV